MHQPGSILLVSWYELGHQPLAVASPLGFLERVGYSPYVLDVSVNDLDAEKVEHATFIGISVPMHTALRLGVRVGERIRQINPTAHICFYGLYASLNADYLLNHVADSIIGGEFEGPLVALIEALDATESERAKGNTDHPVKTEGVRLREQQANPFLERLEFSPPSFRGLPALCKYAHLASNGVQRLAGYVEASRGCLHHCLHCPIPPVYNGRFFVVPGAIVLDAIRNLVQAGATHITFGDPDFLNGPGHSLRVVRAMHKEFPELTFDFTAKVEHLLKRRDLLAEFADHGCLFVISAFESLSDTVLRNLSKGHSREDIYNLLEDFREVRITLRPTWVPFTPWSTIDDYIDLLEFAACEQLIPNIDPVQYTIRLLVPPGSSLLEQAQMTSFLGPLDQPNFSYRWTHPDPRMDELHDNVNQVVEQMIQSKHSTIAIFERVRELAYAAKGETATPLIPDLIYTETPRLTESWFC
jgi:radical SAM superfamily enzyme YgiQ (UPF0313 family)